MDDRKPESLPRSSAIVAAVVWFLAPLLLSFVMPKFTQIFTSVLGSMDPLPWFTKIVVFTPQWVYYAEAFVIPAGLLGKEWLVDEKLGGAIDRAAVIFAVLYVLGSALAVYLPILELQGSLSKK
jgi:type II secretory pathway component PulF